MRIWMCADRAAQSVAFCYGSLSYQSDAFALDNKGIKTNQVLWYSHLLDEWSHIDTWGTQKIFFSNSHLHSIEIILWMSTISNTGVDFPHYDQILVKLSNLRFQHFPGIISETTISHQNTAGWLRILSLRWAYVKQHKAILIFLSIVFCLWT